MGHRTGRLESRPSGDTAARPPVASGLVPLALDRRRDGFLYVPAGHRAGVPAPLSVKLHGAGSDAKAGLLPFLPLADARGLLLLGTDSRGRTWDVIEAGFGPDVAFLDLALDRVFTDYAVDPGRISIEGFSDGASYALSLGVVNGDLFGRIVAFSPGFMVTPETHGRPSVFVSHGRRDRVLPIDRCSRRLVPRLQGAGYDVTYREFDGGHTVPPDVASEAEAWAAG
ncbi:MAG: alpha/beta hydrolase [Actinomycetota bacterium]|nr:alpha/beta hydrolase [Actinomycetota bacterium]